MNPALRRALFLLITLSDAEQEAFGRMLLEELEPDGDDPSADPPPPVTRQPGRRPLCRTTRCRRG